MRTQQPHECFVGCVFGEDWEGQPLFFEFELEVGERGSRSQRRFSRHRSRDGRGRKRKECPHNRSEVVSGLRLENRTKYEITMSVKNIGGTTLSDPLLDKNTRDTPISF